MFREPARPHWPPGGAGSRRRVCIAARLASRSGLRDPGSRPLRASRHPAHTSPSRVSSPASGGAPLPLRSATSSRPASRVCACQWSSLDKQIAGERGITSQQGRAAGAALCVKNARTRTLGDRGGALPQPGSLCRRREGRRGQPGGPFRAPDSSVPRAVPGAYGSPPIHAIYKNTSKPFLFFTRRVNVTFLTNPQPTPPRSGK